MASGKGADSTKSTNFGLLWGSLHRGLGNGFRKRSGLYKIDNFWAFVGFPPFRRSQKPEIQQIHRGLGNGFRKRSRLYKIDKFWAFVGFPPFRRSQKPEIQQNHRGLGNGFRKRSGLYKIDESGLLWGSFPAFRRSQKPAIQENPQGPWKWLPGKERALQNRQILGFCEGSLHFGGPRSRKCRKSTGAWKWLPEKERALQNRQILGFCGVPFLHFGGPRSRKSSKSTGALEMAFGKGADSAKSTNFGLLWSSFHFGGPRSRKFSKSTRGLGNGFRRRSGLYKIDRLGFCGVPSISAVPEAGNPQGLWKWLPQKERILQNLKSTPFGLLWAPPFRRLLAAGNCCSLLIYD